MSKLDKSVRLYIEETIDNFLSGDVSELEAQTVLTRLGIEPTLESSLSFIVGAIFGIATVQSATLYGEFREEDATEIADLLSRRVMELRQYYLQTRNK